MPVERHILEKASEIVAQAQHRMPKIRQELEELEVRKAAIESELRSAELMAQRLSSYVVRNGTDFQCPRCWLEEESASYLRPNKGGQWRADYFVCELCALEVSLSRE